MSSTAEQRKESVSKKLEQQKLPNLNNRKKNILKKNKKQNFGFRDPCDKRSNSHVLRIWEREGKKKAFPLKTQTI